MMTDAYLQLADAQDLSSGTTSDVIDFSVARDMAVGNPLYVIVTVDADVTAASGMTIQVKSADDAAISTNATTLIQTDAIAAADLTKGVNPIVVPLAPNVAYEKGQRYLAVEFSGATAGKVSANISLAPI